MKKRLLSLLLCVLFAFSPFIIASCSDEEGALEQQGGENDVASTSSNSPMTICIYSIRGEGTTDEAIKLVEEELNRISVRKYNTKVDLILIPEEDYSAMMFSKIKMAIASYNTARLEKIPADDDSKKAQRQDIINSNVDYRDPLSGDSYNVRLETNLPSEVLLGTLDIFLCYTPEAGNEALYNPSNVQTTPYYSMFEILYKEKALAPLKTYLDNEYYDVKSVIYTHALSYVTRNNDYYGVPNNYVYGDYEYMIFNETYVDRFISPNGNGTDKSGYVPNTTANTQRYEALLSSLEQAKAAGEIPENVMIKDENGNIKEFESYDDYLEFTLAGGDFAVARVKGSMAVGSLFGDEEKHSNLDVYVEKANEVTDSSEFCDAMFCIGASAMGADGTGERAKRSMDILRLINTNTEFRNILQYGVPGTHYSQYTEDEDVNILTGAKKESKYLNMNPKYFGNMFLLYSAATWTDAEKIMAENSWKMAKDQILDLVPWVTDD